MRPRAEPHELGARHVDVDQQARERRVLERHRLGCDLEVDAVGGDEAVERVEALARLAVELADDAVRDHERRLRVAGAVHGDEPERRLGPDQRLAPERRRRAHAEALAARLLAHSGAPQQAALGHHDGGLAHECGAARSRDVGEVLGDHLELGRRRPARPQRRVDGEHLVVGQRGQLGRALEVLGQLLPARRARDGGLAQQRLGRRAQLVGRDATGAQRPPA